MDDHSRRVAVDAARRLPAADVAALADAGLGGTTGLRRLRSSTGSAAVRHACQQLETCVEQGADPRVLSGLLLGAGDAWRTAARDVSVDVVWTGPSAAQATSRLTAAALVGVLGEARQEILIVGYAVQSEHSIQQSLRSAAAAGVEITLLLERAADNPKYEGGSSPFPGLRARRLAWPQERRYAGGASLHAKVLVVDRRVALVSSANITGWALERNLECGILVRGGTQPAAIHGHVDALVRAGEFRDV